MDFFEQHPDYDKSKVAELVVLGDELLRAAGSVEEAGASIATAWWESHGYHMRGIFDPKLDQLIDKNLLDYARQVANHGVRARYRGPKVRRKALPHPSAKEYVDEIMASV